VSADARLAPARRAAFEVLRRVFEHEAWADRALPAAVERHHLDPRERAQAQRLAYGAVQRRATSDHLLLLLSGRSPERLDPPVTAALRLGLFELMFSSATPDHAAVDQAVELAKGGIEEERRARAAAGLVNAVLRRAAREREALMAALADSTPNEAAVAHSYPVWLAEMWFTELGPAAARSLMAAMNEPAETAMRANTLRADPAELARELRAAGQKLERPSGTGPLAPPEALVLAGRLIETARRRISEGELIPQSRASQGVVALLDPRPGERVLDLCAAPGVKATAIAARMANRGEVTAVELDPGRAGQLRELCGRASATAVRVVRADAASDDVGDGYDRILVDPPCSDLGALASRPDARWRKSPEMIERLASVQGAILERAGRALRPGGTLVYSTCTISAREGEERIAALLAREPMLCADDLGAAHPDLASPREARFLQTRPDRDRTDGFFIARLRRRRTTGEG
jgi:16S rRNA (cytosine967-C5)-methyltransferase